MNRTRQRVFIKGDAADPVNVSAEQVAPDGRERRP
jgi:hypothetical protein